MGLFRFPKLPTGTLTATDTLPIDFPRRAYSFIWNFFYRDETLQDEIDFVGAPRTCFYVVHGRKTILQAHCRGYLEV